MSAETLKTTVEDRVRDIAPQLIECSHWISDHPEIGLEEHESVAKFAETVDELAGVTGQVGYGSQPTAYLAEVGSGDLVVALCAEYDALSEVGHACGHNIIATTALGAFAALVPLVDELGITLRLLGTPAEENEGGKIVMLREGAFDGVHAALMIHPGPEDLYSMLPLACTNVYATFTGRDSHASNAPEKGINALDAATLTLAAIGLARQQMKPGQQIHGVITEGGGAPNVIPGRTKLMWNVRGTTIEDMWDSAEVLRRCIEGAAHATGCTAEIDMDERAYASIRQYPALLDRYAENAEALGRTMSRDLSVGGSTDMGNVSQLIPSIHPKLGLGDESLRLHTREFQAAARGEAGDAAVVDGAILLAQTVVDASTDAQLRATLIEEGPFLSENDTTNGAVRAATSE